MRCKIIRYLSGDKFRNLFKISIILKLVTFVNQNSLSLFSLITRLIATRCVHLDDGSSLSISARTLDVYDVIAPAGNDMNPASKCVLISCTAVPRAFADACVRVGHVMCLLLARYGSAMGNSFVLIRVRTTSSLDLILDKCGELRIKVY